MVGIKFCECLFIVCHSGRATIFISISMSHTWRPPSHAFFGMSHAVAYHEVGSSVFVPNVWDLGRHCLILRLLPRLTLQTRSIVHEMHTFMHVWQISCNFKYTLSG